MADGASFTNKQKPRIAFTGEEFGFGYIAATKLMSDAGVRQKRIEDGRARDRGLFSPRGSYATPLADGGFSRAPKPGRNTEIEARRGVRAKFDFANPDAAHLQPLRTKEQALLSLKSGSSDLAVIPFYSPYSGYDYESLRAIANLFTVMGVEQIDASDQYCLAVYEPQVLDIVQSSHPGSALSSLQRNQRHSWGTGETANTRFPRQDFSGMSDMHRADLNIDQAGQLLLRDRIDMVFCGPEAARRCKSKLDGLRAAGVDVTETLRSVEPHREMARLARKTLDQDRQVNTMLDPRNGANIGIVSSMNAGRQDAPLYGVILPFQVAMMAPDYTIIDTDVEDAEPTKTRFLVVRSSPDETLFEDEYRTTDAKTKYWMRRLHWVRKEACLREDNSSERNTKAGVRVLLRFLRSGSAAGVGDVESYLRHFGVRFQTVRIDEDSEGSSPAAVVMDIEFDAKHFDGDINYDDFAGFITARFNRRLAPGSVVNGAMKLIFQKWKNRSVLVLSATPFNAHQLAAHGRRRWYWELPKSIWDDIRQTIFVRFAYSSAFWAVVLPLAAFGLHMGLLQATGLGLIAWVGLAASAAGNVMSTVISSITSLLR